MAVGLTFLVLCALYLLFAGTASLDECIAAAASGAIGAACLWLTQRCTDRPLSLAAPWHRVLGKPVAQLVPDAVRVGWVLGRASLGRGPAGVLAWQRFRHGGDDPNDNPGDAGRRALSLLAVSLAPNGYVVDLPGAADAMLVHRLAAASPRPDADWPL